MPTLTVSVFYWKKINSYKNTPDYWGIFDIQMFLGCCSGGALRDESPERHPDRSTGPEHGLCSLDGDELVSKRCFEPAQRLRFDQRHGGVADQPRLALPEQDAPDFGKSTTGERERVVEP